MPQEESLGDFADRVLSHIFRVTVDPSRLVDAHGHKLTFLPGVSQELQDTGEPLKLNANVLDSAILEAATAWPQEKPLLNYLLPCWKRAVRALGSVRDNAKQKREVLEEAKRLCMSNCLFALTIPDLFR
jgi:ubiquitin conjugation factor E4 B